MEFIGPIPPAAHGTDVSVACEVPEDGAAGTIGRAMADQPELSLADQLKEIGGQLDWVRGYL
jgi:hypothetical protein